MKRNRCLVSICVLALVVLLVGCSQQAPAPTAKPAATSAPAAAPTAAKPALAPTSAPAAPATAPAAVPTVAKPAAKPEKKGTIVYGTSRDFGTNDPYLQASPESLYQGSVFESLMQFDFDGKIVPALATGYKWVNDKTIEYTLRKGVKFHNGDPFTAADVKFSVERALSPYAAKSSRTAYVKEIEKVDVVDDYTVRFTLKKVFPVFPLAISPFDAPGIFLVVPKTYIETKGDENFEKNPIGTGPYKYKSRVPGSKMVLEAFDSWWGPDPWDVVPTAKEIEIRTLREDQTRLAALLAGELDVSETISFASFDAVQSKPGYRVLMYPIQLTNSISINTNLEKIPNTDKPNPFMDRRVRQAMRYAIDTDSIVKNIMKGQAPKTVGPWNPPGLGAHPERLTTKFTYNPDKARQLLKEANYPNDLEVPGYYFDSRGRPGWPEAHLAAHAMLRNVGINVKSRLVETSVLLEGRRNQTLFAWSAWPIMYPYLSPVRTSGLTTKDGLAPAYTMEGDKKMDELVAAAEAVTDPKEMDERWFKVYDYLNEHNSWISLYVQPITYGLSPRVDYKVIPPYDASPPQRILWQAGYPK